METLTKSQAIEIGKSILKNQYPDEGWTMGLFVADDMEDFIWGYLYDEGLQYEKPIFYVHENGHKCAVLVHQEKIFQ